MASATLDSAHDYRRVHYQYQSVVNSAVYSNNQHQLQQGPIPLSKSIAVLSGQDAVSTMQKTGWLYHPLSIKCVYIMVMVYSGLVRLVWSV